MAQYPLISLQKDYYGKPFRIIVQNTGGVWVARDAQTVISVPVSVNNNQLQFIISTETAQNIVVTTNDQSVTVTLQDYDMTINQPVGSQFSVSFANYLSTDTYVTQTRYVLVNITVSNVNDIITFYLS